MSDDNSKGSKKARKRKGILGYPTKSKVLFIVNKHALDSDEDDSSDASYEPEDADKSAVVVRKNKRRQQKTSKSEVEIKAKSVATDKCWSADAPKEILVKIFSLVLKENIVELRNLSRVCKLWHQVCADQFLWRYVNLANKKYNYSKFLTHSISQSRLKFTQMLNLNGQSELRADDLEQMLKQCVSLNSLSISDCKKIKTEVLKLIADCCPKLEKLDISSFNTEINFQNANYLFEKLNQSLKHLNLARNTLNKKVLSSLFSNCANLQHLDLSNCNSNCKLDLELFADKCKQLYSFKMINISNNCYFEAPKNPDPNKAFSQLSAFHYAHNGSNQALLYLISKFCKESKNLKTFELSGYKGDDTSDNAENIFEFISSKDLATVYLTNSTLSNKDCKRLVDMLTRCGGSNLHVLDLSWTKISEEGFNVLIKCLTQKNAFKIKSVNFSGTSVEQPMVKSLYKALKATIKEINLSSCRQIDRGMKRLLNSSELHENFS